MKRLWIAVFMMACMVSGQAQAGDHVFHCRNLWNQSVLVTVEAETVNDARKALKTDKDLIDKYSLDRSAICAFRTTLKEKPKKKAGLLDKLKNKLDAAYPSDDDAEEDATTTTP